MTGPTVYGTIRDNAVSELAYKADSEIAGRLRDAGQHLRFLFTEAIHRAYVDGMRDGYVQGVAAEAERKSKA